MEQKDKIYGPKVHSHKDLAEGEDYYINEKGQWVFTTAYHLKRGYCCQSGCRHCPYGSKEGS